MIKYKYNFRNPKGLQRLLGFNTTFKKILIVFLLFIGTTSFIGLEKSSPKKSTLSIHTEDYKAIFEDDYIGAEQTIKKLEKQFLKQFPIKKRIAQSIVFPELIRYNLFRDLLLYPTFFTSLKFRV